MLLSTQYKVQNTAARLHATAQIHLRGGSKASAAWLRPCQGRWMVKTFVGDTSRAAPSTDRVLMVAFRLELATRLAGSGLAIAAHETPVHPV